VFEWKAVESLPFHSFDFKLFTEIKNNFGVIGLFAIKKRNLSI